VPAAVQDKLLQVCVQNLAPQGIAYISYNTYPGWRLHSTIRDMMLYHTQQVDDPDEQIVQARELLDFLGDSVLAKSNPHASFLHSYVHYVKEQFLPENDDAFLFHNELAEVNEPVYFYQFAERAAQHGLRYLAEAQFQTMLAGNLPQKTVKRLRNIAKDTIALDELFSSAKNKLEVVVTFLAILELIKLKEVLAADVFSITETDLKKHYNAVKKVKYKIPNKFNIQRLWVQEKPTAALHELFAALLDASQKGVDFPSLAAGFSTERFKVNYETRKFNEDTAGYDERRFLEIKQIVATLSLNEISGVIRNQGFLNIIKLISRETMGFYCFDKTKENVHRDYVEKLYEHYLHDLLSRAKVKINKKVYHTITAGR